MPLFKYLSDSEVECAKECLRLYPKVKESKALAALDQIAKNYSGRFYVYHQAHALFAKMQREAT